MLSSFSLICTKEIAKEAILCISSIRRLYDQPIILGCDAETKSIVEAYDLKDVDYQVIITPESLKLYRENYGYPQPPDNSHHNSEVIAMKMDVISYAVRNYTNTFFVDSDVIILREVHNAIWWGGDCMLSPHFYGYDRQRNCELYGVYNAGYLWTRNLNFADRWREIFLYKSDFLEQQGMIWLNEYFDVGHFTKPHNIGFWRMSVNQSRYTGKFKSSIRLTPEYIYSIHHRLISNNMPHDGWVHQLQRFFHDHILQYIPREILSLNEHLEKN